MKKTFLRLAVAFIICIIYFCYRFYTRRNIYDWDGCMPDDSDAEDYWDNW